MTDIIARIDALLANTPESEIEEFEVCRCLRDAKAEIEKLVGVAAFSSPDMVKWLTDQVMRRDNVIEAMKSAGMKQITKAFTENRWIPVTERLPEPGRAVLIFFRATDVDGTPSCIGCDGNGGLIALAAMDRIDGQHLWTSEYGDETPTHWMPLPAPPTDAK